MKISIHIVFSFLMLSILLSQNSNKDAFFLDLGVVIEPKTGQEKVDHLVKLPPPEISFFLDKKPSGSVFMASTKEITLMLEGIQSKINMIESSFSKDVMQQERDNYKKIAARISRIEKSLKDKLNELESQNHELKTLISNYYNNNLNISEYQINSNENENSLNYSSDNLESYENSLLGSTSLSESGYKKDNFDKSFYINGVLAYQRGNYILAVESFEKLNLEGSSVSTISNVLYWFSESLYNLKKYNLALNKLNKLTLLKNSDKQDDAIILKGMIFKELGELSNAKEAYAEIVDFYPKSEYLRLAKMELLKQN